MSLQNVTFPKKQKKQSLCINFLAKVFGTIGISEMYTYTILLTNIDINELQKLMYTFKESNESENNTIVLSGIY